MDNKLNKTLKKAKQTVRVYKAECSLAALLLKGKRCTIKVLLVFSGRKITNAAVQFFLNFFPATFLNVLVSAVFLLFWYP